MLKCTSARRPFVVVTTNDERSLPEAFLRRCCYLHIPFPENSELEKIIETRLGRDWAAGTLARDVYKLIEYLRGPHQLKKKPGTAELIDFLLMLHAKGTEKPDEKLQGSTQQLARHIFAKDPKDKDQIEKAYARLASDGGG